MYQLSLIRSTHGFPRDHHLISFVANGSIALNINFFLQSNNQPHGNSCMDIVKCCKTSNPCLNGGTCLLPSPISEKRFRCKCADGYKGERCEDMCEPGYKGQFCNQPIRSCKSYGKRSRVPGKYTVLDVNDKPFKVFCDFDNTSSMTWTLIQSYQLKNNNNMKWLPLSKDFPRNENSPSWSYYRLSQSRMKSIQADSTKWRLTCRYDTDGVVYTDYVRGLNVETDIISQNNSACVKTEYINVRGYRLHGQHGPSGTHNPTF